MTKIGARDGRRLDGGRQLHHVPHGQFQDLSDGYGHSRSLATSSATSTMLIADGVSGDRGADLRDHGGGAARMARSSAAPPASTRSSRRMPNFARSTAPVKRCKAVAAPHRLRAPSTIGRPTTKDMKVLRRRLMQAGIYDPRGGRVLLPGAHRACARARGRGDSFVLPMPERVDVTCSGSSVIVGGIARLCRAQHLSRSPDRARAATSTASGFPDFMDLLVVCADAGLQHGGFARSGRARARRFLSVALPPISIWPISKSAPAAP